MKKFIPLLIFSFPFSAIGMKPPELLNTCQLALEYQPYLDKNITQWSPSEDLKAIWNSQGLEIRKDKEASFLEFFPLAQFKNTNTLTGSLYFPEIYWSPSEDEVFLIPHQDPSQEGLFYYVIHRPTLEVRPYFVSYPKNVTNKKDPLGIKRKGQKLFFLNDQGLYGIIAYVKKGNIFKRERQVILLFSSDHKYKGVLGYHLESGYELSRIYKDSKNPFVYDFIYFHEQYSEHLLEKWDLKKGIKLFQEWYLPNKRNFPKQDEVSFSSLHQSYKTLSSDFSKYFELKSPNGDFTLQLNPNLSLTGWRLEIFKMNLSPSEDQPFYWKRVYTFHDEIKFDALELYWYNRGDKLVVNTGAGQVWIWDAYSQGIEIVNGDFFEIKNHSLFVYYFHRGMKIFNKKINLK